MLATPVAPPAPKAADAPTPTPTPAEPTVTPATPVVETTPTPAPAEPSKAKRKDVPQSIGEKIEAALKADAEKKAGKPAEPAKPEPAKPEPTKTDPAKASTTADDSDEGIKAEIEIKTKGMDGAGKQAWADLRYRERDLRRQLTGMVPQAKVTEFETQITTLKAELETAKTATPTAAVDPAEVKALKDQIAEMEGHLTVAKVEATKEFENAITKPRQTIDGEIAKFAKKYELDARKLMDALTDTSEKQSDMIVEVSDSMNRIDQLKFSQLAEKLGTIKEKEDVLRAQSKEALTKLEAKAAGQTEEQSKATKAARMTADVTNWTKLETALPEIFGVVEGDDAVTVAWNTAKTEAKKFAFETEFGTLKPEIQSELLQRGAVYPLLAGAMASYKSQLAAIEAKLTEAQGRLSKFEGAEPTGGGKREGGTSNDTDPAKGEKDWAKRVSAKLAAAGIR